MDYLKWVERLYQFVHSRQQLAAPEFQENFSIEIHPPLSEDALERLAKSLDCGLPPPLREFLRTAASYISFQYSSPPDDGPTSDVFCDADSLFDWRDLAIHFAKNSWLQETDWPLDFAFWRHALPLVQYPPGDGVALWVHAREHENPAIVYLSHEGESVFLSRTFDEFLKEWERLGYCGTNGLPEFRNPKTGFLDSRTPNAVAFRTSLGLHD